MRRRALLAHLNAQGCTPEREGGNHTIYVNPATGVRAPVPRHNEIPIGTARSICRQLGIDPPRERA